MADFATLMQDLDRCEHGRHKIDDCVACPGGHSTGNLLLKAGTVIGHTMNGDRIAVPAPGWMFDPREWVRIKGKHWYDEPPVLPEGQAS